MRAGAKGGPEIALADTLPLQINNSALTGAGTGVQVLWQFYEILAVPCLCFLKNAQNEMARFRANDTMVLNGMICLFVSSQEGRRREGMYIWCDPNHFVVVVVVSAKLTKKKIINESNCPTQKKFEGGKGDTRPRFSRQTCLTLWHPSLEGTHLWNPAFRNKFKKQTKLPRIREKSCLFTLSSLAVPVCLCQSVLWIAHWPTFPGTPSRASLLRGWPAPLAPPGPVLPLRRCTSSTSNAMQKWITSRATEARF